jgi:hypothetical protein
MGAGIGGLTTGTLGLPRGLPSDDITTLTPQLESGEPGTTGTTGALPAEEPFAKYVNRVLSLSEPHVMNWREQARECRRFVDGHQLSDEDLNILRAQRRPDTALNELQKFLKFASGIERRTPQALLLLARVQENLEAMGKGELMTRYYDWFCDSSSAPFERSLAFWDKLVTGIGIVDIGLSKATDLQGTPRYNHCDPADFFWPETGKENFGLDSASPIPWMAREQFVDVDEAVERWPDSALFIRASSGSGASDLAFPDFGKGAHRPISYVVPWIMTEPLNKNAGPTEKPDKVPVLEFQYWRQEQGFYFADPLEGDTTWLSVADFNRYRRYLKERLKLEIADWTEASRRVYRRAYLLRRRVILSGPKVLPTNNTGFTWNVMTGAWDISDRVFYGMARLFIAPQRYANAFFRQTLEIMGTAAKGGYLAETTAITLGQKREMEDTYARPGAINLVQPGAISQNRMRPKETPQVPPASLAVLQFCMGVMEKMSGLSMSLLGQEDPGQSGVATRRRLTAGMVLLAAEFDALSRFRKREGRLVMEFMKFIADGRLVRIGGVDDARYIPLARDPFALEYDVVLDETEQDPNLRQYYTDQVLRLAPTLVRMGYFLPELLDYVNLPMSFRQKLKQKIAQAAQQRQQMAMMGISPAGRGKPRSVEEMRADTMLKQARAVEAFSKARSMVHGAMRDDLEAVFRSLLQAHEAGRDQHRLRLETLQQVAAMNQPRGDAGGAGFGPA